MRINPVQERKGALLTPATPFARLGYRCGARVFLTGGATSRSVCALAPNAENADSEGDGDDH